MKGIAKLGIIYIIVLLILILAYKEAIAQQTWAHVYSGSGSDWANSIQQTSDGGYIVAGTTSSFGAGSYDALILRLDHAGSIFWQKTYGGISEERATDIQQISDGGYIVAGYTDSFGAGLYDYWILKLDSSGNVIWQKTYGGSGYDNANAIKQTSDGGYIVAGYTDSFGAGLYDYWILKLDSSGNVIWQKAYGGSGNDYAYTIQQTSDDGYIVAGSTESFSTGLSDYWILKLDSSGNVIWQKAYGGSGYNNAKAIEQTSDGGYIVAGYTDSFGAGLYDYWILKLDSSGNITWQKAYGGSSYDLAYFIYLTNDGGYIAAGRTRSFGAGNYDNWILKLDSSGNITWQKAYGRSANDNAAAIQQISDSGYIVAGYTYSFGAGDSDIWVLKLDSNGTMDSSCTFVSTTNINPTNSTATSINTSASITSTSITATDTSISGANSPAIDTFICSSCSIPSGIINNTVTDLQSCQYTGVQISWNVDPADWGDGGVGTRSYSVLRDGLVIMASLPYGISAYVDTSGSNGQFYTYRVQYVNGCGSHASSIGVLAADYPAPPTIMNTTANDKSPLLDTGIEISWPVPNNWGDNGANTFNRGFRVFRDGTDISGLLPASMLLFEDTGGVNNIYYNYYVEATNGCGLVNSYNSMAAIDVVTQILDWAHVYGGSGDDYAEAIQQTSDGGYIVAGNTYSFGAGNGDAWILKLDSSGNVVWQKTYGGSGLDSAHSIQQTSDGGYIVAESTASFGAGNGDAWILKLDYSGNVVWQKTYGGSDWDFANAIQQTSDGGYIVAGVTYSFGAGDSDYWILKLDASGNIAWQRTYGGSNSDYAEAIQQTSEGGYIVAGETGPFGANGYDYWILKLDPSGNITWQKTYGDSNDDFAYSIMQTSDGGYLVAGYSYPGIWILKLDLSGDITWQKIYSLGSANSIQQTSDGGYIVAGYTASFGAGSGDAWILKLDASGNIAWQKTYGGSGNDAAQAIQQTGDGGYIVAGSTGSFGVSNDDIWVLKLNPYGTMNSSCNFIAPTNINPVNSSATVSITNVPASSPSITISDTGIIGLNSSATNTLICQSEMPAPGAVPDNDNYPGMPLMISKSTSNLILNWSVPGGTCITNDYGIYRGTLPWIGYDHSLVLCTTGGLTSATIAADNDSYFYLVVAQAGNSEGSYGLDSGNTQRPTAASPCFPQQIGTCN